MSAVKPALHKVRDVATILSVSEWEVRRLAKAGVLHVRYVGEGRRFYRITTESIEAYLESLSPEPADSP